MAVQPEKGPSHRKDQDADQHRDGPDPAHGPAVAVLGVELAIGVGLVVGAEAAIEEGIGVCAAKCVGRLPVGAPNMVSAVDIEP